MQMMLAVLGVIVVIAIIYMISRRNRAAVQMQREAKE
jgi:nucleoside permease NupC